MIEKQSNTGLIYTAVQIMLHSSKFLHHSPADDDCSAVIERVALGIETGWRNDSRNAAADAAYAAYEAACKFMADILCEEFALAPIGITA